MTPARQIHLVRRPKGIPVPSDFAITEVSVPEVADGEVQVEALWMSVDPYMRPRLDADQPLDAPLLGGGFGRITQSRNERFKTGDLVRHGAGFQERFTSNGKGLAVLNPDPALPCHCRSICTPWAVQGSPLMAGCWRPAR
jgi:NADPH-dependent curcumin reductase CurA